MSWHCSRALEAAFSAAICSGGDASAPSSSTPTPDQYYWPDKTTEHSRLSRFGMTCVPLTADRGAALLTWFLADSRARTSAQPEKVTGSTGSAPGSGRKWLGLLARYDRDSRSWRTPQCSLVEGLDEFSETWPRWGSMRSGECWERRTWELRMSESESGLWPTPCATDCADRAPPTKFHLSAAGLPKHIAPNGEKSQVRLSQAVKMWPTVCARDFRYPGKSRMERTGSKAGEVLPQVVGGPLNPDWTEWLMGWPIGQTALGPLGTDKFHEWQQQHGAS
jgi:hypothetical protein